MNNFEIEVRNMHKKEVQSLYQELADRNEPYYEQVASEKYENINDYEADIMTGLIIRILIVEVILLVFIVGYFLL